MGTETETTGNSLLWARRLVWIAGGLLCVVLALAMLHARLCAFTNFKDGTSGDYARYTNMIWNTLHGRPFLCFMDTSYLVTHLSFSLALLSPLFLLFDHPFLLALVQWALLVLGAVILWRLGVRLEMPGHLTLALLVFWLAHPFVQSVVLCEFHGVSTYFVTVPLLYYCLVFRRSWVGLPLVVILGLREDAGLVVVPLLLYFAVRERWRAGYWYAAAGVAYVALACLVLYPAINDVSLFARRAAEIPVVGDEEDAGPDPLWLKRGKSLLVIVLTVLPFLRYGWKPLAAIPALAILITLGSSYHSQVVLRIHYPAIIVALLAVALLEGWRAAPARAEGRRRWWWVVCSIYLAGWTAWCYYDMGMMWGSRAATNVLRIKVYHTINGNGEHALWVARNHVPKTGVLWTERRLGGFVANRAWLAFREDVLADPRHGDLVAFCSRTSVPETCLQGLASNTWGVVHLDDTYAVLRRGAADPDRNAEALRRIRQTMIRFSTCVQRAGDNLFIAGEGTIRYWEGRGAKWPAVVAYGKGVLLPAGRHTARFTLKVQPGDRGGSQPRDTGVLALFVRNTEQRLAEAPVAMHKPDEFREQELTFALNAETEVEARVFGGAARLWLIRVVFEPAVEAAVPDSK